MQIQCLLNPSFTTFRCVYSNNVLYRKLRQFWVLKPSRVTMSCHVIYQPVFKRPTIKMYREMNIKLHTFLTLVLERDERRASCFNHYLLLDYLIQSNTTLMWRTNLNFWAPQSKHFNLWQGCQIHDLWAACGQLGYGKILVHAILISYEQVFCITFRNISSKY